MEHKNRTAASRNTSTSHQQLQSSSDVQANSNRAASSFQSQSGEEVEFDYIDNTENELDLAALLAAETDFGELQDDEDWSWFDELPKAKQECLATLLAASTQPYAVAFTARRKAALKRQHHQNNQHGQYVNAASLHKDTMRENSENVSDYAVNKKQLPTAEQSVSLEQSSTSGSALNNQSNAEDFTHNFGGNGSKQFVLNQKPSCSPWKPPKAYTSSRRRPYHNPNFTVPATQTNSYHYPEDTLQSFASAAWQIENSASSLGSVGQENSATKVQAQVGTMFVENPFATQGNLQDKTPQSQFLPQDVNSEQQVQVSSKINRSLEDESVLGANGKLALAVTKSPVDGAQSYESIPNGSQYDASDAKSNLITSSSSILGSTTFGLSSPSLSIPDLAISSSSIPSSSVSGTILYKGSAGTYANFGGFYMVANGLTMSDAQATAQTGSFVAPKFTEDATKELAKEGSSGTLELHQAQPNTKDGSLRQSSLESASYAENKYADASNLSWAFSLLAEPKISSEQSAEITEQDTQAETDKEEIDSGSASVQMSVAVDSGANSQPQRRMKQRAALDLSKDTFSQYETETAKALVVEDAVVAASQFEEELNSELQALLNTSYPQISNFEQFRAIVFCCMRQQSCAFEKVTERSFQKYCLFIDKDTQHFTVNISFNAKGIITKIYSTGKSYAAQCCVKALKSLIGLTIASKFSLSPIAEPSSHSNVAAMSKDVSNSSLSEADDRINQSQYSVAQTPYTSYCSQAQSKHCADFMGNVSSYTPHTEQNEGRVYGTKQHLESEDAHTIDSTMAEARTLVHTQEQIEQIVSNFLAQQKKMQEQSITQLVTSAKGSDVLLSESLNSQQDAALVQREQTHNSLETAAIEQTKVQSLRQPINSSTKGDFAYPAVEQTISLDALSQTEVESSATVKQTSGLEDLECSPETWSKAQRVEDELVAYTPHAIAFTDLIHNLSDQMEITLLQIVDKHYQKQCLMRNRFGDILKVLVYYKSSGEISKVRCAKDQLLSEIFTDALLAKKFIVGEDGRCMVV